MRNVGNMHAKTRKTLHLVNRKSVVEIACITRIDRKYKAIANIAISLSKGTGRVNNGRTRLFKRRLGKSSFQLMVGNYQINIEAVIAIMTKNFLNNSRGRRIARRILHDTHPNDIPLLNMGIVFCHREDVVENPVVFGHDHPEKVPPVHSAQPANRGGG